MSSPFDVVNSDNQRQKLELALATMCYATPDTLGAIYDFIGLVQASCQQPDIRALAGAEALTDPVVSMQLDVNYRLGLLDILRSQGYNDAEIEKMIYDYTQSQGGESFTTGRDIEIATLGYVTGQQADTVAYYVNQVDTWGPLTLDVVELVYSYLTVDASGIVFPILRGMVEGGGSAAAFNSEGVDRLRRRYEEAKK